MPVSSPPHNLLSAWHLDTLTASVARGSLIIGNSTPKWSALAVGANGTVLTSDGTDVSWQTPAGGGITIGTTTITSGTSGRVLYNNAGVVGEMTTTGSGTVLTLATAPTLTGPVTLTEAVGSSALTITGATQTASFPALTITQTWNNAGVTFSGIKGNFTNTASAAATRPIDIQVGSADVLYVTRTGEFQISDPANVSQSRFRIIPTAFNVAFQIAGTNIVTASTLPELALVSTSARFNIGGDVFLYRGAAATFQMGADVNGAAVSQTLRAANGITGTDRTGGNFTLASGKGTGAGAVSSLIFQTPTVLTSGTTAQSLATRLTLDSATMTSTVQAVLPASTTGLSSLRLPHGSAPSSPVDGDMWTDTTALWVRINGVTKQVAFV